MVAGFAPVDDEPDGIEDPVEDDDPLGADDELGAEDELLGAEELDEDEPLGDAAGLEDDVSAFAWTPSFAAVSPSRRPLAFSPSFCW